MVQWYRFIIEQPHDPINIVPQVLQHVKNMLCVIPVESPVEALIERQQGGLKYFNIVNALIEFHITLYSSNEIFHVTASILTLSNPTLVWVAAQRNLP